MKVLVFCFLLVIINTLEIHSEEVVDQFDKIAEDCLLTIAVNGFGVNIPLNQIQQLQINECQINYFYWITDMTYDNSILQKDKSISLPLIVRSNADKYGYLSFLFPLVYNSTYTLIINANELKTILPSSLWIDEALSIIKNNSSRIPVCGKNTNQNSPFGCMLIQSLDLRYLWMKTEFRKQPVKAMDIIYHSFQCLFHSEMYNDFVTPSFLCNSSDSTNYHYTESSCVHDLNIEPLKCSSSRKSDGSVGIVITQYRRNYFPKFLKTVQESSTPVKEILVYQNLQYKNYRDTFKQFSNLNLKHVWSTNWNCPFFCRFIVPFVLNSYYLINFDDDVLLKKNTIRSLVKRVSSSDSISGLAGRQIRDVSSNRLKLYTAKSKKNMYDFIIITYATKLEYLKVFWRYRPVSTFNGEDIHLGLSNYVECGRRSFVSVTDKTTDFINKGSDSKATYKTSRHNNRRAMIIRSWISGGYQLRIPSNDKLKDFPHIFDKEEYRKNILQYFLVIC